MKRIVRRDHLSVAEAARDAAMLENGRLKGLEEAVNAVWESAPSDPESLAELEAFRTAADALRAALDAPDDGWASVEERLPEPGTHVIVVRPNGRVFLSQYRDLRYHKNPDKCKKWDTYLWGCEDGITHWRPLPEPPKSREAK